MSIKLLGDSHIVRHREVVRYVAELMAILVILLPFVPVQGQTSSGFPAAKIDASIIAKRGLEAQVAMLSNDCNWQERIGKKIDVFWLRTEQGDLFGHSYEYFLDCDNLRLIWWYDNPESQGKPVDFMIENLEDESQWVVAKRKHLKNRKKYKQYLD